MLKISNVRVEIDEAVNDIFIAKKCAIPQADLLDYIILKKSIDARKKNDIHYVYSFALDLKNENKYKNRKEFSEFLKKEFVPLKCKSPEKAPLIVGAGPCGLFAALYLCQCGISPILIERGEDVDKRIETVNNFWEKGEFSPISNVQFGEGGAGTFSDGKLNTGVNDERLQYIKEQLVKHGAPEEILYLSKPHIGTDKLCKTVKGIRNEIISLGGKVYFNTQLIRVLIENDEVVGAVCQSGDKETVIECGSIFLAVGHSARDTFEMIKKTGAIMEKKTFSVGARIEHLQSDIGISQYGALYEKLPAADYKLSVKNDDGRGVYTFCMCPGGSVVASASEEEMVVTNGMSCYLRDNKNANSAVLVTVNPEDIEDDDVLGGVYLQREIEKRAYIKAGKSYYAPVQLVGDFLNNRVSDKFGKVIPTYKPGVTFCNLRDIFPDFIADALCEALPRLNKKLLGFADAEAVLTAPETRSSSPVRIIRNKETFQSNIKGLYPCGEGAGYAGGIMSASLDGIKTAMAYIRNNSLDKN